MDDNWSNVDAWTWKTDFEDANEKDKNYVDWIQSCLISTSQQSEILVISHEDRYAVLTGRGSYLQFKKGY